MDEICPACGTVHQGFSGRDGQHHSFWQCRRCNVTLFTIRTESGWEVHGEALAASLCPDIVRLYEYHKMLRTFTSFIGNRMIYALIKLTEDADSMSAFYTGLMTLHKEYEHV